MRQTPHCACVFYQAWPALPRSALIAFFPVLFGAGTAVSCNLSLALSRLIGVELHSEESIVSTCTEHYKSNFKDVT